MDARFFGILENMRFHRMSKDQKERLLFLSLLAAVFIILVGLELFLTHALLQSETLKMQGEAERAFNTVYMDLQDGGSGKATRTMQNEHVAGLAVYNSTGRRMLSLGDTPLVLDLAANQSSFGRDFATGAVSYNAKTGNVEYVRMARLSILMNTENLFLSENGNLSNPMEFPDVLYLVMDGSEYHARLVGTRFLGLFAALVIGGLFLMVLRFYLSNLSYRQTLSKQENLVSLGQAARTLTHEIKNPLSAIKLQLAILKKTLPDDQKGRLEVLDCEVERLVQLTNKVSDFLRNPVGSPTVIDLTDLFAQLVATFGKKIPVICEGKPNVLMDADRARSVFENLLKNALESTSDGRDPKVEVSIFRDKRQMVHVRVMDRGDGISKENGKKIFDPFFTTKIHGSGIGLAISRQFVKARGGDLTLSNREGGGAVAEVVLPANLKE